MNLKEKFEKDIAIYDSDIFCEWIDTYTAKYKELPVIHIYYLGRKDNLFWVGLSDNLCYASGLPYKIFTRREAYTILTNIKDKINTVVYGSPTNKSIVYRDAEIAIVIKKLFRGMRA